jgi:transposase
MTKKELEEKVANLEVNVEYATRIVWLIVNELGGNYEITKEMIENANFTEVRVSDTVNGGLYIEVAPSE